MVMLALVAEGQRQEVALFYNQLLHPWLGLRRSTPLGSQFTEELPGKSTQERGSSLGSQAYDTPGP